MLTQLTTVKARLNILETDTTYDALLTNAIKAVSARFDRETNRTLARTVDAVHEFDADATELRPRCYPIESVSKFELKANETDGWVEQPGVEYLIRSACVISLRSPLSTLSSQLSTCRLTYTGGYLVPGASPPDPPVAVCQDLPEDLEQAAVEQVAYWFRNRDKTGLIRSWPSGGVFEAFLQSDLLLEVKAVLERYERFGC